MTDAGRPYRTVAAFFGAVETVALLMTVIALLSMGGDGLDRLLSAFAFMVFLPVAVLIGIFLGIRFGRSASSWGFARPRQVIISVIVAFLVLGLNSLFQEMGLKKREPLEDPFVTASADRLIKSLSDPEPESRVRAAEELVRRHYPSAGNLILPLLQDKSGFVRGRAIVLLGQLREKRAVDRVVGFLGDPDYGTQLDAVRSLGEIGDKRAVVPLLAVLDRPHFGGVVAEALAKIGDERAVGPLIGFLENAKREDQLQMRNWVATSLEKLSGQKYGTDILRWRQWYEAHGKE
jgi:HEAT repeat protein